MLSFKLLGQASLQKDGVPLNRFRSQKEAALLIYLAQTGQSHPRDFLADLLWDSRSTKQALANLRTVLTRLRKQVDDDLVVTRQSLTLTTESRQQVDSGILLDALARVGPVDTAEKANTLQQILDAYQGDFLADFYLPDAPQFDEWVTTTREHIRRQVIAAYDKLGQYARTSGDVEGRLDIARRWLQVDALDQAAHTLLIQQLLNAGQTQAAVTHYRAYVDLLRTEANVEPSAEITALLPGVSQTPALVEQVAQPVRHNLPVSYDQFFGRVTAQQDILTRLDQAWCRLVTIVGPGGVGKTRLATTIARRCLNQYRDGVWLVELADIDPDDDDLIEAIAVEIATALDLRLSGAEAPIAQLLAHLQHKQMLLVMDNFEHLLADGIPLVLKLIQSSEKIQLLVTSREALRIRAEWTIALTGLDYPTGDTDETASDAVDLFAARRVQQRREAILADDLVAMSQICRLVEGLPLAIELAAALTSQATLPEIAAELRHGFDTLTTALRDVPHRHRSLRLVFEMSWRTLSPALQQRLAQLSVFRGGFTEIAAQQIAEADAQELTLLADKSLLSHDVVTSRYRLHPVVRTFAAKERPPIDPTPQKHAHYYLALLAEHTDPLQKAAPQQSIALLEPDIANIRLAWQTGLAWGDVDSQTAAQWLFDALTSLSIYFQLRGLAREGEAMMETTLTAATAWGDNGLALATRAGLERTRFQIRLGRYRPAIQTVETALHNAQQGADRWAEGMGQVLWGEALWRQSEYAAAKDKLTHALDIAHALDATLLIGWCHHHLGVINDIQSRYDTAHDHLQQACTAWRTIDNAQALSNSLNSIGLVSYHQGDFVAAQQSMEEALTLCNQLDNRHLQSLLLNNLSMISIEQGDYLDAHHYLQLGLALVNANGDLAAEVLVYTNLGKNYRLLGKADLAVKSLKQAMHISESIGNRPLLAMVMGNLAETQGIQRDPENAESLYSQALLIARQDNLQHTECEILVSLSKFLSQYNEPQAREYSAQAVVLAQALENPDLLERATAINHYLNVSMDTEE